MRVLRVEAYRLHFISRRDIDDGERRTPSMVRARRMMYYLLRTETRMSCNEIATLLKISHATVLRGAQEWEIDMALSPLDAAKTESGRAFVRASMLDFG